MREYPTSWGRVGMYRFSRGKFIEKRHKKIKAVLHCKQCILTYSLSYHHGLCYLHKFIGELTHNIIIFF